MTNPSKYSVPVEELVESAHVPIEDQVEEHDATAPPTSDEGAGHLPGNVRPYGA